MSTSTTSSSTSSTAHFTPSFPTVLTDIDISNQQLVELPADIVSSTTIRKLNAGNNSLTDLPSELERWSTIRILFFLNNRFTTIPTVIAKLSSLYMLSFKSCLLTDIPDGSLPSQLVWLILTDNRIPSLPSSFSYSLSHVRKLMLASNHLASLPTMTGFQRLELVRLSDNRLTEVSTSNLYELPKLAWLALGGNPCTVIDEAYRDRVLLKNLNSSSISNTAGTKIVDQPTVPLIPLNDIEIGKELGQGASGTVYKGIWNRRSMNKVMPNEDTENTNTQKTTDSKATITNTTNVAVKLFKPASSDGKPEDEVAVALLCSQYGITSDNENSVTTSITNTNNNQPHQHPNFIHILGYINETDPRTNTKVLGLVLEYLPSTAENEENGWTILARPPSFETVTRDTFPSVLPDSNSLIHPPFTSSFIYHICKGLSSVLQYLHSIGIVHGDVYAHNIMVQPDGTPKLGDLGAAFIYPYETIANANSSVYHTSSLLEYVEVRGYGCLIDDLLLQSIEYRTQQSSLDPTRSSTYTFLSNLRDQCTVPIRPSDRPTFTEIMEQFNRHEQQKI